MLRRRLVGRFPVSAAAIFTREIALGLKHIHGLKICHRDIKPQNVIMSVAGELRICDFGVGGKMDHWGKVK
jgi:serine/threonine protein kinase